MKNKKLEWLRVGIFVLIAFVLTWIPMQLLISKYGVETFSTSPKFRFIGLLLMFPPAIAHIITRAVTKEGWKGMHLHLNLKGNIKYYLFSVVYVYVLNLLSGVFVAVIYHDSFSFSLLKESIDLSFLPAALLMLIPYQLLMSFDTFGEEFGWRAYLYPKLEGLLNSAPLAGIIGGIIWGLWHMPLINAGHNFGTEYPGFPWLGNVLMCLNCTSMGIVMMWVTRKTKSIYPACIMHAVNNYGGSLLLSTVTSGISSGKGVMETGIKDFFLIEIPSAAIAVVCIALMIAESKKNRSAGKTE